MIGDFVFYAIALCICVFAFLTVTSQLIFRSAIWLSLCLMSISLLYFYLDAQFLGVIQVLVYVGGIITLFIFAIKLTAKIDDPSIKHLNQQVALSALAVIVFFCILMIVIVRHPWPTTQLTTYLSIKDLGRSLMTNYMLPFEFISVVLLGAMVGAIVIGKEKK